MLPQLIGPLLFFLATTSLLSFSVSADVANWIFPAVVQNAAPVTFESQDTIDAAWTSEFVAPMLVMFCDTNNDGDYSIDFQSGAPVLPNESYGIPLTTVQKNNSNCHLNLYETNGPLMGTVNTSNSGAFLVNVLSDRSATTWSASVPAATSSSTSPSIATPTSTSTSTSTPPTTSASKSPSSSGAPNAAAATATATGKSSSARTNTGLSSGAKAGIGVGVALGVLALLSAGLLLWMRARRKQRQVPPPELQYQGYGETYASQANGNRTLWKMDGGNQQEEKDGDPIARPQMARELEAEPAR